ncbi:matrix metalloproteinase-17-like [Oncorhynchus masou masou]|uniref:matrix metalloproteinase-17-like n=1 Tax=Oncorhynchus masou masou TaxID=90313 RepID=UPI003183EB81
MRRPGSVSERCWSSEWQGMISQMFQFARRIWIISPEMLLLPMFWFLSQALAAPSLTAEQMDMGVDWLSKFGYLPPPDPVTGQLQTKEALTKAIKAMQKFGGLEETGVLDQATLGLMKTPRCSLPDLSETEAVVGRRRRALTPQNKWSKRHLSWRIRTFPKESPLLGRDTVRALMYYALKVWSDISPLNFHEVAGNDADIQIDFTKADHNDGYPFDGPGGTVAHAFFPGERFTAGDTHFDDDEAWTFRSPDSHGMDLFAVAVHEFGHAIGLAHTSAIESIMRPYYQGPVGDPLKYDLPYEDKVRVWQLYGVRDSVSHTARPDDPSQTADPPVLLDLPENRSTVPPTRDAPNRCTSHFDAVAQIRGEAFFFKGKYFWRLTREKHLVSLRPAQTHRFWRGLPTNLDSVDAVYERPGDHKIIFFKGLKYWIFKDNNVEEGYPRPISDFGLPMEGVDAAFVWLHNDKTYFFKDNRYWRYDDHLRRMDQGYPKDSTLWKGIPSPLDDAMRWSDSSSYFFKGKEYWRVVGSDMEVEAGYPRSIGKDWLVCTEMQSDSPATEANNTANTRLHGQHHADHAENGYEVCSCTSNSASPLGAQPSPSPLWLLALLTVSGVLSYLPL